MHIGGKKMGGILYHMNSVGNGGGLKSAAQRQERKEKSKRQIAFWTQQKENLKNRECATLEEIERKLEMFHTYEDEIAAARAAYNNEQAFHILDEAKERGDQNAEAVKKQKPKTPKERKEEMAREALGLDEEEGVLAEALDEMEEALEKLAEEGQPVEKPAQDPVEDGLQMADEMERMREWSYKRFDGRI